ncbi:unnamed protein product [Caenorhabditis bovis]|uniref:C2 domain-containing protein n=1 Tax=Caenorhabditis bovis TaxID=2654633 RepID=A0A8S1FD85_9PELO|nr:unnamed protein product [Caenorhabditis bovis]
MKVKDKLKKATEKLKTTMTLSDTEGPQEDVNGQNKSVDNSLPTTPTNTRTEEQEFSDEDDLIAKKNFGSKKFVDGDKPSNWNLLVRIIEAKDIDTCSARVRIYFDGKQRTTRTVTTSEPKWRQNILFAAKKQSLETISTKILTLKLAHPTFNGERPLGEFSCYLSEVIHSPEKSVIGKWVALGISGGDEDETDEEYAVENCGFLKIRFFGIEMLMSKLLQQKKKKPPPFYVQVKCGEETCETSAEYVLESENLGADINFDQEIYLPIQWPTVISKISFFLFVKPGRKAKCIGMASIPMKQLYEPGEKGFLPTFGPAYLNLFDYEKVGKFKWFSKRSTTRQEDGSRFVARLFISIDCVEYMGESTAQRLFLDYSVTKEAENLMSNIVNYVVCCSFHTLNMINPLFASDAIQILVSIGGFGSMDTDHAEIASSTVAAMPNYDGCKYFAMPWGNLRPMVEVPCYFENVESRIELANALMKMTSMLDSMIWEVLRVGNCATDHVASIGFETIDYLMQMVEAGVKYLGHLKMRKANDLDRNWLDVRRRKIEQLKEQLSDELYTVDFSDTDVNAKILRTLTKFRDMASEMAADVQISLPPVVIKMVSMGKLIGFAKIPIQDIFQADKEAPSGEWCGRSRPINLCWPTLFDRRYRLEEFVAVLHAKLWFGRKDNIDKWKEHVEPAEKRYFREVYEIQTRASISMKWKSVDTKSLQDAFGNEINMNNVEDGWETVGNWLVMNTHDMWISNCGQKTMHDKAYEVQKKNEDGEWVLDKYTDYYGYEVKESDMKKGVEGWELSAWIADKLRNNGDKNGWVYSSNSIFFGDGIVIDREAKPHHNYRRRCIKRSRKMIAYKKEHENLETFRNSLDDTNWEYSSKKHGPYHDDEDLKDTIRRRRYIVEMEKINPNSDCSSYRIYEHQLVTAKWQLRCYIMWAKDLLPVVKNSSRAYARISFAQFTKQTLVVDNSQNPIWNETVIFRSVLIAGGTRDIMHHPPIVSVEIVGECENNAEAHLGRFEAPPTVICANTDSRAKPQWFPLRFPKGHTRGAVLACFELFEQTDNKDCLPFEPAAKFNQHDKREIPAELRPEFDKYNVQFLCWGIRNLKKHQLLSVRRPFIEITIGDQEFCLDPLKDVRKNPNFPEPMISFTDVQLPSALDLSPPLVVNLFDSRAFNRRPLVGVCLIQDLHKYVRNFGDKKNTENDENWDEFASIIDKEHEKLLKMERKMTLSLDLMVPLDWWSRYYASLSQFHRAPGYLESGMEYVRIMKMPLEDMNGYNGFNDFLDTFYFVKNSKGDFDDPEEKEKAGELKARLLISKIKKDKKFEPFNPYVDFVGPVKCVVRVYIIEANGLMSSSKKGRIDPYVVVGCGKQKVSLKKNYRSECANPIFGERVDLNVTIPLEKDLTITVMDKRTILRDEEIGTTKIDLENRLLTKWRATCGLSAQYTVQGELQWRDQMTPLEILKSYCNRIGLDAPKIVNREKDEVGISIDGVEFYYSDVIAQMEKDEKHLIEAQREKAGRSKDVEDFIDSFEDVSDDFSNLDDPGPPTERKRTYNRVAPKLGKTEAAGDQQRSFNRKKIMGSELEVIALFILRQVNLVPEHIETRPLVSDRYGNVVRGNLRMFVDIFPKEYGPIPVPFNISPRKPVQYQLRVSVMNVTGAIPIKRSFNDPVSDLYIKVFVNGMMKGEKTDTHFRILDGNGEFNWRFVLNFDFNPWEQKIVAYTKTRMFRKAVEELVDPIIIVELWDKNKLKKDILLGDIELDLLNFMEGLGSPDDVGIFKSKNRRSTCRKCRGKCVCMAKCCIYCFDTRCFCKTPKPKLKPFPRPQEFVATPEIDNHVNMFDARDLYGWWPMLSKIYPHENVEVSKKHEDVGPNPQWIMGLVEMDISLLTKAEADMDPVGKKRDEPNHSPFLEKPNRKACDSFWITSRLSPCLSWFWHNYGGRILFWTIIVLMLLLTIYFVANTWPASMRRFLVAFTVFYSVIAADECRGSCSNDGYPRACGIWLRNETKRSTIGKYQVEKGYVELFCAFASLPEPVQVQWQFRPSEGSPFWSEYSCSNAEERKICNSEEMIVESRCILRLKNIRMSGSYRCHATIPNLNYSRHRGFSTEIPINVVGIETPRVISSHLPIGQTGHIDLEICANPKPEIFWVTSEGLILPEESSKRFATTAVTPRMIIERPDYHATALPYCYSTSLYIHKTKEDDSFKLIIRGDFQTLTEKISVRVKNSSSTSQLFMISLLTIFYITK